MNKISRIPKKLNDLMNDNPFYAACALYDQHGHVCSGRITRDHSIENEGSNVQEIWAITPVCALGHGVDGFKDDAVKKVLRRWVALNRATDVDILKMTGEQTITPLSKAMVFIKSRIYLNKVWGTWISKTPSPSEIILSSPTIA